MSSKSLGESAPLQIRPVRLAADGLEFPCYGQRMSKLSAINPYLPEPAIRERAVLKSVATSSAIEGIRAPFRRATNGAQKPDAVAPRSTPPKRGVTRA